ncbi:MAG: hypothetical protein J1F36_00715 [Clostridiales bacterium]|nr:hypothetical protein [Clostridiales bacterium]
MYTYGNLMDDIAYLNSIGVETGSIGSSLLGNKIFYIHVGKKDRKQIIITGGIHARENVTALLVMRQAYRLIGQDSIGIFFVPMVNPDGALLIEKGASAAGIYEPLVRKVNGSDDFSLWKANARAVDLNINFDAKFGLGKGNITYPAPQGYIGAGPFSEPETAALRNFTLSVRPVFTVSYHALGRELYWYFGQKDERDRRMAYRVADYLRYRAVDGDLSSTGGYKDWCVMQGIPAVTIEIGSDKFSHPLSEADVAEDIKRNLDLPQKIVELYKEIYM